MLLLFFPLLFWAWVFVLPFQAPLVGLWQSGRDPFWPSQWSVKCANCYWLQHYHQHQHLWGLLLRLFVCLFLKTVADVHGRTFAVWTLLTCTLCVLCAFNLSNRALYQATFLSFVYALGYFLIECFIYGTMAPKNVASLFIFAGTCRPQHLLSCKRLASVLGFFSHSPSLSLSKLLGFVFVFFSHSPSLCKLLRLGFSFCFCLTHPSLQTSSFYFLLSVSCFLPPQPLASKLVQAAVHKLVYHTRVLYVLNVWDSTLILTPQHWELMKSGGGSSHGNRLSLLAIRDGEGDWWWAHTMLIEWLSQGYDSFVVLIRQSCCTDFSAIS